MGDNWTKKADYNRSDVKIDQKMNASKSDILKDTMSKNGTKATLKACVFQVK